MNNFIFTISLEKLSYVLETGFGIVWPGTLITHHTSSSIERTVTGCLIKNIFSNL